MTSPKKKPQSPKVTLGYADKTRKLTTYPKWSLLGALTFAAATAFTGFLGGMYVAQNAGVAQTADPAQLTGTDEATTSENPVNDASQTDAMIQHTTQDAKQTMQNAPAQASSSASDAEPKTVPAADDPINPIVEGSPAQDGISAQDAVDPVSEEIIQPDVETNANPDTETASDIAVDTGRPSLHERVSEDLLNEQ